MIALLYADINISGDAAVTLRKIPFDTLMRALLDGYERELTEEEVREKTLEDIAGKYARVCDGYSGYETSDEDIAFSDGMVFVLDALNIKIPEVNA
ncbi:hypothetical protein NST07_26000 [Paenibacillus sp. FSL L8-0340]|uniref:hypothetical protein n=1 Tax=Paenibacillus sp. FSL L8-0340 TaxID=2954685 RepID=UPI003158D4F8